MPTSEHGSGQLFQAQQFLCEVSYELDYPLGFMNRFNVRRIRLVVQEHDAAPLLALNDLALVTAAGTRHFLPQPLTRNPDGRLECTVRGAE